MNQAEDNARAGALAVIGMRRSGLSLVSRVLGLSGLVLVDEANTRASTEFNPDSHRKQGLIVNINDRVLGLLGGSWSAPPLPERQWADLPIFDALKDEARELLARISPSDALWGWKDPRTTLTIPFWRHVVPQLRFVLCLRNPVDVTASLGACAAMNPRVGMALWHLYTELALVETRPEERIIVSYEDFFHDHRQACARLLRFAALPAIEPESQLDDVLHRFIDREHRHNQHEFQDVMHDPEVPPQIKLLYDGLVHRRDHTEAMFAKGSDIAVLDHAVIDAEARTRHRELKQKCDNAEAYARHVREEMGKLQRKMATIQNEYRQMAHRTRELEAEYDKLSTYTMRLLAEYDKGIEHRSHLEAEYNKLADHIAQLQAEYKRLSDHTVQLQAEYTQATEYTHHLERICQDLREYIAHVNAALEHKIEP